MTSVFLKIFNMVCDAVFGVLRGFLFYMEWKSNCGFLIEFEVQERVEFIFICPTVYLLVDGHTHFIR